MEKGIKHPTTAATDHAQKRKAQNTAQTEIIRGKLVSVIIVQIIDQTEPARDNWWQIQ